ncbi:MAG: formylglycine-generating enzyme family protein [Krumholzibacteria bacterium]|nr:formylglycine-generating enzyme family protein [Candidatus Krumholzibacteria bacterium]
MESRLRRIATLVIGACVVVVVLTSAGCDSDPSAPPLAVLPTEAVVVNGGQRFTGSRTITVEARADGLDSVLVWNGTWEERHSGRWYEASAGCVEIPDWYLDSDEGPVTVRVSAVIEGLASHSAASEIILDLTPPLIGGLPLHPEAGASDVSAATDLRWSGATDGLCPADSIVYVVLAGVTATPQDTVYVGRELACLVPGLTANAVCYWQVNAVDLAGNVAIGPVWTFGVWAWNLPVFRRAPAATFVMGSPESEFGHVSSERQHTVTLTRDYLIASTEMVEGHYVPLLQWALGAGYITVSADTVISIRAGERLPLVFVSDGCNSIEYSNMSFVTTRPDQIVKQVTWYGAMAATAWLSELAGGAAHIPGIGDADTDLTDPYRHRGYRLPTEAEWEHACRAGTQTAFANGEIGDDVWIDPVLDQIGWYYYNYTGFDFTPGHKIANAWGLYDMHGGVPEWCWDWYGRYPTDAVIDPINIKLEAVGDARIIRGSLPLAGPKTIHCRSAFRSALEPYVGLCSMVTFRLVWSGGVD